MACNIGMRRAARPRRRGRATAPCPRDRGCTIRAVRSAGSAGRPGRRTAPRASRPWLWRARRSQPSAACGDAVVVALVGGVAAAGVGRELERGFARRRRIAQHADRVADALHHVQRHVLLGEAIVVLGAAEVQFADRIRRDGPRPSAGAPRTARCRHRRWRCPRSGCRARSGRFGSWRARARRSASCSRRR